MSITKQIARLSQNLPPEKQTEVRDFVEFLVSRQVHSSWTAEVSRGTGAEVAACSVSGVAHSLQNLA